MVKNDKYEEIVVKYEIKDHESQMVISLHDNVYFLGPNGCHVCLGQLTNYWNDEVSHWKKRMSNRNNIKIIDVLFSYFFRINLSLRGAYLIKGYYCHSMFSLAPLRYSVIGGYKIYPKGAKYGIFILDEKSKIFKKIFFQTQQIEDLFIPKR